MAGEHPWTQATVKLRVHKGGLGGIVFSPSLNFFPSKSPSGFGSKSAELNKKIPQGLFELGSSKVHAMSESPWADGQNLPWGAQAAS